MMVEQPSPELKALRSQFDYLSGSISVDDVLAKVRGNLINERDFAKCKAERTDVDKAEKLLQYVERSVTGDPAAFYTFVDILDVAGNKKAAQKLRDTVAALKSTRQNPAGSAGATAYVASSSNSSKTLGTGHDIETDSLTPAEIPQFELKPDIDYKPMPSPREESKRQAVQEFATRVQVVIQACNDPEYYAALEKLGSPQIENQEFPKPVVYSHDTLTIVVGTFAGRNAAILRTKQGLKCKDALESAFKKDNPIFPNVKLLIGLGVCYGLRNNSAKIDLQFADVLIGKEIKAFTNTKHEDGTIVPDRFEQKFVPEELEKIFCEGPKSNMWNNKKFVVCEDPEQRTAKAYTGCLASEPILVNDPGIIKGFEDPALHIIGGEMEGWAQIEYAPEKVKCIIIKGIADYGDGTKMKIWQFTAAKAAVDYALFKLEDAGHIPWLDC